MQKQGLTYQAVRSQSQRIIKSLMVKQPLTHLISKFPSVSDKAHREDETAQKCPETIITDSDRETDGYN